MACAFHSVLFIVGGVLMVIGMMTMGGFGWIPELHGKYVSSYSAGGALLLLGFLIVMSGLSALQRHRQRQRQIAARSQQISVSVLAAMSSFPPSPTDFSPRSTFDPPAYPGPPPQDQNAGTTMYRQSLPHYPPGHPSSIDPDQPPEQPPGYADVVMAPPPAYDNLGFTQHKGDNRY